MESSEAICYQDFLTWYRRSGGGLVAESKVSKRIEESHGKLFVPHLADAEILSTIQAHAEESAFLMEIVGVPGVGKTKFLIELINGLNSADFETNYRAYVKQVNETFDFLDIGDIDSQQKQSATSNKKRVWVTLNIDEFVSTLPGENPLVELYAILNKTLSKGESLIISGNIGVLENDEARQSIEEIRKLIGLRNQRPINLIRFPPAPLFWTKEYGIELKRGGIEGDPYFLVSGQNGFQSYSVKLIKLCCRVLEECSTRKHDPNCKTCIGPVYLGYLKELEKFLEEDNVAGRLHDLLQYLWLKNTDVYLVARALNIFWGYALTELWTEIESYGKTPSDAIESSLIFTSLYLSKVPSLYRVSEYALSETNVHRFRNKNLEQNLLRSNLALYGNPKNRLQKRLEYFFEKARKTEYREMIYGGIFEEYIDERKLATYVTEIARRLVLLRLDKTLLYVSESDDRFSEIFREPWGFVKILFGTKVTARSVENGKKRNVPLMIFHESVLNEVDVQSGVAFEETQTHRHYLSKREKTLQLILRGPKATSDLQNKAPSLHLGIDDYASLRELIRGVGNPDITLKESTQIKVSSFTDALEGFVTHQIRPLIWKHIKEDLKRGDTSRILARVLGPATQRCSVSIEDENLVFRLNGTQIAKILKEVPK
jgi:hypothetical protein